MKKRIIFLSIGIIVCFLFVGCSEAVTVDETPAMEITAAGNADDPEAENMPQENLGMPENSTFVVGRVKSIVGNEVVLELGEIEGGMPGGRGTGMPSMDPNQPMPSMDPNQARPSMDPSQPMPSMDPNQQRPSFDGEAPSGSGRGQGGFPGGGGGSMQDVEITYTGEEATYLLPVGMEIGSGDFSSVTEGMILRLSLNNEETIVAVTVISA